MTMTLTKNVLRELVADTLRDHRADAPGDCADALMATLKKYAPKSFTEERIDVESDGDKFQAIAEEMIKVAAFNIDEWEIHAAYPRLTDAEVTAVNDAIGVASVTVNF